MSGDDNTPVGSGDPRLDGIWLFASMPAEVRRLIEAAMTRLSYSAGEVVVAEGEPADAYYVLVSGMVTAVGTNDTAKEVVLGTMQPGDAFGERALVEEGTRTSTVRASSDAEVLALHRSVFQALTRTNPRIQEYVHRAVHRHELRSFVRLQTDFTYLPSEKIDAVLNDLRSVWVSAGKRVLHEGDAAGAMYLVRMGELRVFSGPAGAEQEHEILRQGDLFGERSVLLGEPHSASVEAITACELLTLTADAFHRLANEDPKVREAVQRRIAGYKFRRPTQTPLIRSENPSESNAGDRVVGAGSNQPGS